MNKHECIHFHGLVCEIYSYLEDQGHEIETEAYDELEMKPTNIHKSKTDHKVAIFTLIDCLVESIGPQLKFSEEDVLGGKLIPKTDDEATLPRIFSNLAESEPRKVINHVPILISFIQNGNINTQKHAIESINTLSRKYPQAIESYSNELNRAAKHVHEVNLKDDLITAINSTQRQRGEDEL